MSKKNILLAITNGFWLIDMQSAEQMGHNVANVLKGEKFWNVDHKSKPELLIVGAGETGSYYSSASGLSAKPGSVAVLNISGPIMKEDNCGDPGTKSYETILNQLNSNPNIIGVVLNIDSPGGTVSGTQSLSNTVATFEKPIVTLAEDLMASAAYWIGSSADYIFANTGTTRIGSIGTMLTFVDMRPVWEAEGVVFHEIYASKSTQKNTDFAEARKKNYKPIIDSTLDPLNNEFLASVQKNRGKKLNTEKTLNGQVYVAADALKYGLIDAIGNLQNAIDKVIELANEPSLLDKNLQNANMKTITLTAQHAALIALFGVAMEAGKDSVEVEMNADNISKLNTALAAGTKASADLSTTQSELAAAKKDLDTRTAELATAQEKTKTAEEALATLKASNPGATSPKKEGDDKVETSEENDVWKIGHNASVLNDPLFSK